MYKQLSREQRYAIYLGIQEGKSQKAIARQNNIHPSTVSREVRRNSTKRGEYQWQHAQKLSDERRERPERGDGEPALQHAAPNQHAKHRAVQQYCFAND